MTGTIATLPGTLSYAAFPSAISEAVASSVAAIFSSILGEKPIPTSVPSARDSVSHIVGIISLYGETKWTLSLILPQDTATAIVEQFCGYPIEFEDADMGDAVGELVNVLAGFVVDELEKRDTVSRMSLPTMLRGRSFEFIAERASTVAVLGYYTKFGRFALRMASAGSSSYIRLPG